MVMNEKAQERGGRAVDQARISVVVVGAKDRLAERVTLPDRAAGGGGR